MRTWDYNQVHVGPLYMEPDISRSPNTAQIEVDESDEKGGG
jgi:hypothetical protein